MNKIFFMTIALAAILTSCTKNDETPPPDEPQVRIDLVTDCSTRVFFGNTAAPETWENEVKTASIYIFDNKGKIIFRRRLTASEANARSAVFSLPKTVFGTVCQVYVVANADYGVVENVSAINRLTESTGLDEYNGTFEEMDGGCKRPGGFVMTGNATISVPNPGTGNFSMSFPVKLNRLVAKIAVRTRPDDSFQATYGNGTITINSITLSKASALSYSFPQSGLFPSRSSQYQTTQITQKNGDYCDAIFYIYENGILYGGTRVALDLKGYFDTDGDAATTLDRMDVEFSAELAGNGNGAISRNGYYRVEIMIKGFSKHPISAGFLIADWLSPRTQGITVDE